MEKKLKKQTLKMEINNIDEQGYEVYFGDIVYTDDKINPEQSQLIDIQYIIDGKGKEKIYFRRKTDGKDNI